MDSEKLLKERLTPDNLKKLLALENAKLFDFIAEYISHCNPESVFVCDDSEEDLDYIREAAVRNGEEQELAMEGHTVHWDNYNDQARDKVNTRILVPEGVKLSENINTLPREEGLEEIHGILGDMWGGREVYVKFGCLGPNDSPFTIPAVQMSDSAYVVHNEIMLFRPGYGEFKKLGDGLFFRFVHSQGPVDDRNTSENLEKRRIYIDIPGGAVYSANNQYGGNSLGFKKHAMRLAIDKASRDRNWLCEHMFIMGVHGPNRVTYFAGAYPSACGKTSTAMLKDETIVGDDIAYLRADGEGIKAANVEQGMFGIIGGVNSETDPEIYKALTTPGEVIFSNVLKNDGEARWTGDGRPEPTEGLNHSGVWEKGKKDGEGNEIPVSHPNSRYTVTIGGLSNRDPKADDPGGVDLKAIVYGGRDYDTSVPVAEALSLAHGIALGASLESQKTFATLGKGGRTFSPMSNIDFLSIPLGKYLGDNLRVLSVKNPPKVFGVNYFLRKDGAGDFLNGIQDKRVWFKWMEQRVHGEVEAIETPVGHIPLYEDLKGLFKQVLDKEYTREEYDEQFTVRVPELLAKLDRIDGIYAKVPGVPVEILNEFNSQRERLMNLKSGKGEYVKPRQLE